MSVAILLVAVTLLILTGIPVAYSLGMASLGVLVLKYGLPLLMMPQRMVAAMDSFPLLAIPLFIFAGNLMNRGGISDRIYDLAGAMVGHYRGGLAQVNVLGSLFFAGMTGSAMADAAGLGKLEINAMRREGYPPAFAAALTAVTSTIGPIIPPSIPFVVYGVLAEVSVGRLFAAGFAPGLLLCLALMAQVYVLAVRRGFPRQAPVGWLRGLWAFGRAFLPGMTVVIIIGGILLGVFTPTEAAAAAAGYAVFLATLVYREVGRRELWEVLVQSAKESAVILFVVSMAALFAWVVTLERVPQQFSTALLGLTDNPYLILVILNMFLLAAGCFLDITSVLIITVPIVLPIATHIGLDPIQLGVMMVLNLMIGGLTPPFAMLTFISARIAEEPFERVVRETVPYLVPLVVTLLAVTFIPAVTLALPTLFFH